MHPYSWLRSLSGRRRGFALGLAVIVLAGLGLIGVRLVAATSADPAESAGPPAQNRPGTVLLVPGYGGSTDSLTVLANRLRAAGRTAEVVSLPDGGTGDLLAEVDTLNTAARQAIAAGAPSVDVIGYSAGGVVARLWVARDDGARLARRVITLGSPLHGTQLATAGAAVLPGACPLACQQLVPDSTLLRQVDAEQLPTGLPWLSLWTQDDQTVVPPDSARLAGAINVPLQQICPDQTIAHSQLPDAPLVVGIVLNALAAPTLTTPQPQQCDSLIAAGRS